MINAKTGMLALLNTVATQGSSGCHLVVAQTGKSLVLANYGNGSVVTFHVGADGRLSEITANVQHSGSGPDGKRQRGPHAHGVTLSPDNRFVFVPDLGIDKIVPSGRYLIAANQVADSVVVFKRDSDTGQLKTSYLRK